jgi:hypothetical protein
VTAAEQVARIRQAAAWATLAYPGPVGEYFERELREFDRLGHLVGGGGDPLMARIVDDIITKARGRNDGST